MKSGYWQDLTTKDFSSLEPSKTVALLPVSAVEQHGPHLPLSTDALINEGIVSGTLRALPVSSNVLVLPSLTVGSSLEHITFPGTLTVNSENLLSFWKSVGSSVCRAGIRKLVLLNSHGGNKALVDLVALQLRAEMQMLVVRANYFDFGMPKDLFKQDELRNGFHGGEVETSLIMHLRPDLVREEELRNFPGLPAEISFHNEFLGVEKPVGVGWMSHDLNSDGVCGNAADGDSKRGATYLKYLIDCLVKLLQEVADTPLSVIKN